MAKIVIAMMLDFALLTVTVLLAYMLRVSDLALPSYSALLLYLLAPALSVFCLALSGVYHHSVRSYSRNLERRITFAHVWVLLAWIGILAAVGTEGFARSVVAIYVILAVVLLIVVRRSASSYLSESEGRSLPAQERIRVLILGAGREGAEVAESLSRFGRMMPMAFVETNYTLFGRNIAGLKVHPYDDLQACLRRYQAQELLIAKQDLPREFRRQLVASLSGSGVKIKILQRPEGLGHEGPEHPSIRGINIEDLLGRDPVPPDSDLMSRSIGGKNVMVTGAGGSIGSEIVRQLIAFGAKRVVLFEQNEFALFEIHREMEGIYQKSGQGGSLVPVLGDVRNLQDLETTMRQYEVEVVFHAAAYKHVRLVQENPIAGARTNIWGSINAAQAAIAAGVELFVLVSTDKAVNPTNVMGATKRWAEVFLRALALKSKHRTRFAIVRFGNVLGSSGSVVPLFREQISNGGPVTVSDPEVTRYFMLIPEAAQLVIQAGAMAADGDVFVLDMGEPVKIVDLAHTMIRVAGLTPHTPQKPGNIDIEFTGLREGEKLHEELHHGANLTVTSNKRIWRVSEPAIEDKELAKAMSSLDRVLAKGEVEKSVALILDLARRWA